MPTWRWRAREPDDDAGSRPPTALGLAIAGLLLLASPTWAGRAATELTRALDHYFAGRPDRAIVLLRDAMTRPDALALREPSLYVLARSFAELRLHDRAVDALGRLRGEFPDGAFAPHALRQLASSYFDLGELAAVANLAVEEEKTGHAVPSEVWYLAGQASYQLERYDEAERFLDHISTHDSHGPFARYTLGQIAFIEGDLEAALEHMRAAAEMGRRVPLLRDRALHAVGNLLHQQERWTEAMDTYRALGPDSPLYASTRIDLALAADSAGDPGVVRDALLEAIRTAPTPVTRAEAGIVLGQLRLRDGRPDTAHELFEQALEALRSHGAALEHGLADDEAFEAAHDELVRFARKRRLARSRKQRNADLHRLRRFLIRAEMPYEHATLPEVKRLGATNALFPVLHEGLHHSPLLDDVAELAAEIAEIGDRLGEVGAAVVAGAARADRTNGEVAPDLEESRAALVWLELAAFDVASRFRETLVAHERRTAESAARERQQSLEAAATTLRLLLIGETVAPSAESVESLLWDAKARLETGRLPGTVSPRYREALRAEWTTDRESLAYVVQTLDRKTRQMNAIAADTAPRARDLNFTLLAGTVEWLQAYERLITKYRTYGRSREHAPWVLAGRAEALEPRLEGTQDRLDREATAARSVVRDEARRLVARSRLAEAILLAQAEEGIARTLERTLDPPVPTPTAD